jgi:hypothetical protein
MRWARDAACMGERRNAYWIFNGKPEGKRQPGISRRRWDDNTGMHFMGTGWEGWIGFIWLGQGTLVGSCEHDTELSGSIKSGEFRD